MDVSVYGMHDMRSAKRKGGVFSLKSQEVDLKCWQESTSLGRLD